jgi:tetraacyldisaccharide 4'-kinase
MILRIIKFFLLPFSFFYGVVMECRNYLYDYDVFKREKFSVPVISIGNITMGGTGKTPFVIWLTEKMEDYYKKIVVVSRGYGRDSKGLLEVASHREPQKFGDEPCLIAVSSKAFKVIVSEDRKKAIRYALEKYDADLIILDDAFQHRSVCRDVDIVLLNGKERFRGNYPLPSGTLREFRHNIERADIIMRTNSAFGNDDSFTFPNKHLFKSLTMLDILVDINFEAVGKITDLHGEEVIAFSGIAHPENFEDSLHKYVNIKAYFSFRDHYRFTAKDIGRMIDAAEFYGCTKILCTEKDMVKIASITELSSEGAKYFYGVKLGLVIDGEKELIENINKKIDISKNI